MTVPKKNKTQPMIIIMIFIAVWGLGNFLVCSAVESGYRVYNSRIQLDTLYPVLARKFGGVQTDRPFISS